MPPERPSFLAALQSLLGSDESFERLIDEVPFNLIVDRSEGGAIYANATQLQSFGMNWEEFRGYGWARVVHPGDVPLFEKAATDYLAGRTDRFDLKYRVIRQPAGDTIWVHAHVRGVRDASGAHVGNVGISFDITSQQQHHERLAYTQKMEAVGRLSGRIAHDFNNLLGVLLACIDTLGIEAPGVGTSHLDTMLEAVERARQITDQLLTLAQPKVRGRASQIDYELLRLEPLIARAVGERVSYRASLCAGVAAVPLDPGQLSQIALNLVANARDAISGSGQVTMTTELLDDRVLWTVTDDGSGMSPDVIARATEAFFTTKSPERGTGLGLATVAELVRVSGGQLVIESTEGRGTRIAITLPMVAEAVRVGGRNEVRTDQGTGRGTILLLEDHDALRQSLALVLSTRGYRVLSTGLQREAIELAQQLPDLVALVTDVHLPDGDGTECAAVLRRERPDLAVVYMSGLAADDSRELGRGETFLRKPVSPRDLVAALRALVGK
jgi:two-component system cell cycle sensor histidine kinase/response regulator CckA